MALLGGLFGKRPPKPDPKHNAKVAGELFDLFCAAVRDQDGRIRVEDLLTAGAAITAEACLAKVGELDVTGHAFPAGGSVLSPSMNELLTDDAADWTSLPLNTVFGIIREVAMNSGYVAEAFPVLNDIFMLFVSRIGSVPWGFVPLSVPEANRPHLMPLRIAYVTRSAVQAFWAQHETPFADRHQLAALALGVALGKVKDAIDRPIALALVFETLNGMAKTAPVHEAHMRQMQADAAAQATGVPDPA